MTRINADLRGFYIYFIIRANLRYPRSNILLRLKVHSFFACMVFRNSLGVMPKRLR